MAIILWRLFSGGIEPLFSQKKKITQEICKLKNILSQQFRKNDKLKIGKKLVLFVKDDFKSTAQKKIENPVYIVKEGDTLWDIANKYDGISVSELMRHNNLSTNKLKPGESAVTTKGGALIFAGYRSKDSKKNSKT